MTEFNLKKELRNIFEKELLGKTIFAGRIYRKLLARDKEFLRLLKEDFEYWKGKKSLRAQSLIHIMERKIDKLSGFKYE